jgi:hypothetical protein
MKTPRLWSCLLAATLIMSSARTFAQDDAPQDAPSDPSAPEDAPMPPAQSGDAEEEPAAGAAEAEEEAPAVTPYTPRPRYEDEQQPEPQRHAMPVPSSGGFGLVPNAGIGIVLKLDAEMNGPEGGIAFSAPLWIGATMYPLLNKISPFITPNFGIDLTLGDVATSVSYMPNIRLGVAVLDGDPHRFEHQLLPLFMGYLIAGARYNPGAENERIRLGVGVSTPAFIPDFFMLCTSGILIPNMIEYVVEVDIITSRLQHNIMLGIGL